MNEHFVNIKVDREERPDLDSIYMTAVQAMTGHGGWPLNVFLTPDGVPFYGGTYWPPDDRQGMPGFRKVLEAVADAYRERREERRAERRADSRPTSSRRRPATPDARRSPSQMSSTRRYDGLAPAVRRRERRLRRRAEVSPAGRLEFLLRYRQAHEDDQRGAGWSP